MYLIKSCPSCNRNLRFPIDRGKITVKCTCSYNFIADPDNPELFNNAKFDLSEKKSENDILKKLQDYKDKFNFHELHRQGIKQIYDFRYKIQNFKLLPDSEKIKLVLIFILITIVIIVLLILLNHSSSHQLRM